MESSRAKSSVAIAPVGSGKLDGYVMAGLIALVGWNYWPTFKWMEMRWDEAESYMAHGWLIPFVSLWLLWMVREEIRQAPKSGSIAGFFLVAGCLLIHVVSGLADVSSISGLTLVPVLLGLVWLRYGLPTLKVVWFPIFFLLFMVPPPEFIISTMNFALKLKAADLATFLLDATGLPAIRQGSFMMFGEERLAIGDVCSGLRSLLSLLSLSVLYAYLIRDKGKAHVLGILLTGIPAAIIGNGIRIFLVAYLVTWLGSKRVFAPLVGTWDLHLFTGAVIFAAAFGCLYLVNTLLDKLTGRKTA
jgi:exosortase